MVDQVESHGKGLRTGQGAVEHVQPGDAEKTHACQVQDHHGGRILQRTVQACAQPGRGDRIDFTDRDDDDRTRSQPVHPNIEHVSALQPVRLRPGTRQYPAQPLAKPPCSMMFVMMAWLCSPGRDPVNDGTARRMWHRYEPIHEVTYFTPEARAAADGLGLRGFWMGYFALRAAPMGPVGPAVAATSFFGFHPYRVARALPDAWMYTHPDDALQARLSGVDAALRRLWGDVTVESPQVEQAAELAWQAATAADTAGRVLAAANQALPRPAQPHLALWQATTTLREHRGDGHNAVLLARGISRFRPPMPRSLS